MITVNNKNYQHTVFGFVTDSQLMCELVGVTEDEARTIFSGKPKIIFTNSDGVTTDYSAKRLCGFMNGADEGNVRILLK